MAFDDFTDLVNSISSADVARGVTAGTSKPNGGGLFVFGMNSLTATVGVCGKYATPQLPNTNYNPLVKGGDLLGALVRAAGGGLAGWDAFLFMGLTGNDVADEGYLLGLSDGDPSHIQLRKGALVDGLPDASPSALFPNVLRQSSEVVLVDTWVHLRLEMVVNDNGDVVLNCYRSDLNAHPVSTPTWLPIPGMASFTDDVLGINSGSVPFTSGRAGFAGRFSDVTRRSFFDHVVLAKQV